jgi:hypothetical protein
VQDDEERLRLSESVPTISEPARDRQLPAPLVGYPCFYVEIPIEWNDLTVIDLQSCGSSAFPTVIGEASQNFVEK